MMGIEGKGMNQPSSSYLSLDLKPCVYVNTHIQAKTYVHRVGRTARAGRAWGLQVRGPFGLPCGARARREARKLALRAQTCALLFPPVTALLGPAQAPPDPRHTPTASLAPLLHAAGFAASALEGRQRQGFGVHDTDRCTAQ